MKSSFTQAIYPGTFDPITNGHLDILHRGLRMFDEVILAVAASNEKNTMFDLTKRVELANIATAGMDGIRVVPFGTLLVDFAKKEGVFIIIRGLRAISDYEFELQMGYTNNSLDSRIDTVYLMSSLQNAFISSSVVRTILRHGGDVSHLVPSSVLDEIVCM